ncbi:hypothetical protein PSPTOT1_1109 [Pseudomonas syringae pv. tomato T1]|nr:hypothetical protein PSPTOT1_1109 [Pseudomonas syringae pv. tomato T1]
MLSSPKKEINLRPTQPKKAITVNLKAAFEPILFPDVLSLATTGMLFFLPAICISILTSNIAKPSCCEDREFCRHGQTNWIKHLKEYLY